MLPLKFPSYELEGRAGRKALSSESDSTVKKYILFHLPLIHLLNVGVIILIEGLSYLQTPVLLPGPAL